MSSLITMATSGTAEKSSLLALLEQQPISASAILSLLQDTHRQRTDRQAPWLESLHYVKFVREVRKRHEVDCLRPALSWALKEDIHALPQLTIQQALKLHDVELLKTVAQCGYDLDKYRDEAGLPLIHQAVLKKDVNLVKALYDVRCDFSQKDLEGKHAFTNDAGTYLLLKAVADKKADIVFILKILQCGVDVNCEDENGRTPLLKACQGGNENKRLVKTLLEQGANIHHQDHDGNSAIILACRRNHLEVVEVLLREGANIHDRNKRGTTPILQAAALGKDHMVKLLLQEGANINDSDKDGMTPLIIAIKHKSDLNVQMLTEAGASCHASEDKLIQILHNNSKYIDMVYNALSESDIKQEFGKKLYVLALEQGHFLTASSLIRRGVDLNVTLASGKTPFEAAVDAKKTFVVLGLLKRDTQGVQQELQACSLNKLTQLGNLELIQQKLKLGVNPNEQDSTGNTVIHNIVESDNLVERVDETDSVYSDRAAVMQCLYSAGADLNMRNKNGDTPLHLARNEDVCTFLLKHGAQVNAQNNQAQSPLLKILQMHLEWFNSKINWKIIPLLVQHGADILQADRNGNTPLSLCVHHDHHESGICLEHSSVPFSTEQLSKLLVPALENKFFKCIGILLKHGADPTVVYENITLQTASREALISRQFVERRRKVEVNEKDRWGVSPLMLACENGNVDVVKTLLEHGAKVDDTDSDGSTALFYCRTSSVCAKLLLQAGADPNHCNKKGNYPCSRCNDVAVLEELLAAGADINKADARFTSLLIYAVYVEDEDLVNFMLTNPIKKADLNVVNRVGETALSVACSRCDPSMVSLLLQHGADCNIGPAPLTEAFKHDNLDVVGTLLSHGCNPNQTNSFGETLLVLAAHCGDRDKRKQVLNMLDKYPQVDVNARDEHGRSLLHSAVGHKSYLFSLLPFLIKHGAYFNTTDAFGRTILHDWRPKQDSLTQLALREVLRQTVDVNQQDYNGHTAMHLAVLESDIQLRQAKCRELMKFGADLSKCDKNGLTVYHLATHDPQLFHSLLRQVPCEFHSSSLDMMHTLSRYFETEESISEVLRDIECSPPAATSKSKVNVTFESAHGLADWSKAMAEHITSVGHHNYFAQILHTEILCSYPPPKMAEIQEKARTVLSLFRDISKEVGKYDKMLEFTPFVSGSSNEGTKVILPDEMDMLCVLHHFKNLSFEDPDEYPSLLYIDQDWEDMYCPFTTQDYTRMLQSKVFNQFYYAFGKALQNEALWEKYPKLYRLRTDDMSHSNQSITDLSLVWHGEHFPFLEFSVDVVPAFNGGKWLPKHARKHQLLNRNGILAIPKFRIEYIRKTDITELFQASFERSEADLFHMMPVALKQAYMLAKIIKSKIPMIELYSAGMFVSSYLMKTCTFSIFQDHPEYEERLKQFLKSDKESAALTQQPYDPHPLAPVSDIIYWCEKIFSRLEQGMVTQSLSAFFMPKYNLISHKVYGENYRPQLMARICKTMLLDPATEQEAWQQLSLEQPWKIAELGDTLQVDTANTCECSSYFCIKKRNVTK